MKQKALKTENSTELHKAPCGENNFALYPYKNPILSFIQGLVHPKMKIMSLIITHPHVVPSL